MQPKCVEMSITITAALAAASFAIISRTATPIIPFVVVLGAYSVIQSLILANYIYHTFMLSLISSGLWGLSRHIHEPIANTIADALDPTPDSSQQFDATLTNCFQPLIVYGSIVLGCVGFAVFVICLLWDVSVCLSRLAVLAITLLAWYVLRGLYKLHKNTEQLAKCWCWILVNVNEKDRGIWKAWRRARSGAK